MRFDLFKIKVLEMKTCVFLFVFPMFLLLIPGSGVCQIDTKSTNLLDKHSASQFVGKLGQVLGDVFRVEFQLVKNGHNKSSDSDDDYRVMITKLNDDVLSEPVTIDFTVDPSFGRSIILRSNFSKFSEEDYFESGTMLDREALEEKYIGRTYQMLAYESGRFRGFPRYPAEFLPKMVPAARGFGYSSQLVLIEPKEVTGEIDRAIEQYNRAFPDNPWAVQTAREEGVEQGFGKGKLAGRIQILQEILQENVISDQELWEMSDEDLQKTLAALKLRLHSR